MFYLSTFISCYLGTSDLDTATSASKLLNVDIAETSTLNQLPNGPLSSTSVISETIRLALVLSSCVIIVVGIILAVTAFMIWKQRNRWAHGSLG